MAKTNSLFGDYAPELKSERVIITRMMQRGILKNLAAADKQGPYDKQQVLQESAVILVQEEYLQPGKAEEYLQIFADVYGWGITVPGSLQSLSRQFEDADIAAISQRLQEVMDASPEKKKLSKLSKADSGRVRMLTASIQMKLMIRFANSVQTVYTAYASLQAVEHRI